MGTRNYDFIPGVETGSVPPPVDPSSTSDMVSKGYADRSYARRVADLAALKAIDAASRTNVSTILVTSLNLWFRFDPTLGATADDVSVVAPSAGTGRWLVVDDGHKAKTTDVHGVGVGNSVVGTGTAQTLSGKTFSDALKVSEQSSTPAAPAAGFQLIYPRSDGKWYTRNSAGGETEVGSGAGGGGAENFIEGGNAERGLIGTRYANGSAVPTTGTGGTPSALWALDTATPFDGTYSFKYTQGAVGDGINIPFTIPRDVQGSMIALTVSYEIDAPSGFSDGEITFHLKNNTSGAITPLSPNKMMKVVGPVRSETMVAQAAIDSTSYSLLMHQALSSGAWLGVKVQFTLGTQGTTRGAFISEPKQYSPVIPGGGTLAYSNVWWNQVGGFVEIQGHIGLGTTSGSTFQLPLPSGCTIDDTYYSTSKNQVVGIVSRYNAASGAGKDFVLKALGGRTYLTLGFREASIAQSPNTDIGTDGAFGSGEEISISARVKIKGWSSNQVLSSDTNPRRIYARYIGAGQVLTASTRTILQANTKDVDNFNAVTTGSAWKFTAPRTDWYTVMLNVQYVAANFTAGQYWVSTLYKNGAFFEQKDLRQAQTSVTSHIAAHSVSFELYLKAGEYIDLGGYAGPSLTTDVVVITVSSDGNSQQIAASDTVDCEYATGAGQSVPNNTWTTVAYGSKTEDTHGAFDGTTWTCKSPGKYLCIVASEWVFNTTGFRGTRLYKGGTTLLGYPSYCSADAAGGTYRTGVIPFKAIIGDQVVIQAYQTSGGALALAPSAQSNFFKIIRVGNL